VASLVHDDIMDDAQLRHGVETMNATVGNGRALVAGDLLLGQAHVAAAQVGAEAARLVGHTLVRLCEGQAEEEAVRYDTGRAVQSYFRSIAGKTGALIEGCCRMGAIAAGHDAATTAALGRFGRYLGIAYQLADDLLDLVETANAVGKPVGHDLASGVYTYPTLWALRRDPSLDGLLSELDGPGRAAVAAEAARRVRATGALDATRLAIGHARGRCLEALGGASATLGRDGVELLAELALAMVPPTELEVSGPLSPTSAPTPTGVVPNTTA
jgi:geranylgeranyl pyrophosphate synthase